MAHICEICGVKCHCNGDIDDMIIGDGWMICVHCNSTEDDWEDIEDEDDFNI